MGHAARTLEKVASVVFPVATIGTSLATGKFGGSFSNNINPVQTLAPNISRSLALGNVTGANATKSAGNALATSLQEQTAQSAATQRQLLEAPRTITPDNFLSMKNNQLSNLKLGFASTMTGGGGVPSPVVSRPSLSAGGPGKTRYGQ